MKQYSGTYYKVHYGIGSEDCCKCATQKDAELRQAEIRNTQVEKGYKPEETHIYLRVRDGLRVQPRRFLSQGRENEQWLK